MTIAIGVQNFLWIFTTSYELVTYKSLAFLSGPWKNQMSEHQWGKCHKISSRINIDQVNLTSVILLHALKQEKLDDSGTSVITITASAICTVVLTLCPLHATPLPTFNCSLQSGNSTQILTINNIYCIKKIEGTRSSNCYKLFYSIHARCATMKLTM